MAKADLRELLTIPGVKGSKSARRRRLDRKSLAVENLESRDLLTALAWASGASLPTAAAGLVAQPAGSNLLVLAGGSTASYYLSAANPSWQASTTPTNQPLDFARTAPGTGPLANGYYVVYGGMQNGYATSAVTQYDPDTVTVVDGATNQTRALKAMNAPRALLGGATDPSTFKSYAIGGEDNNGTPLASVEAYNPTSNTWTYVASLPQTLYSESAVSDGAGHVYTFGGVGANGAIINNVYRYTIATNTWDQVAPLQVGVRDSAAVLGPDGLIYVLGGTTASGATATVESFNIATNTWTLATSLPQALRSEAAAVDSLGRIEVLGGYDASGNATAAVYTSQQLAQPDLAPTITSSPPTTGVLDAGFSYQVTSTANPQAAYSLTTAPSGMTIDPNTGLINWTPTSLGSYSVTVLASNGVGQTSQTFSVNVVLPTPAAPTGVTGTSLSTTAVQLSWNASTDPYVSSYDVYRQYVVHSPKGSGSTTYYSLIASGVTSTSVTISGSGTYSVTAVNSQGVQSARSVNVSVATTSPPVLYTTTTTSGADISSLTVNVGQTVQIDLVQEFANPAPTFSVINGPSGMSVDPTTGLVTYTPSPNAIGNLPVTFAATNSAGTSTYTFYFNVLALDPMVTVGGEELPYDGTSHGASTTAVGVDGVTPVAGSFAITYNGSSTPPAAAGVYAVQATFTSADPSYASTVADGTLTIDPAVPTITVNGGTFDYDGNSHAATPTAVGIDGVTPVNGFFQITYSGSASPPTAPGLYTVSAAFVSNDSNYASTTATSDLIINSPGTLTPTLSLVDGSASYDGNPHAESAVAIANDGITPVAGDFIISYNGSLSPPTQAGSYAVTATFVSSDPNYANATITGTLSIGSVAPTLVVDPNPFIYDGSSHAALVTALGVDQVTPVDGNLSVTYDGSPDPPVNAGTYNVTVAFSSNDPNYQSTSASSSITILPATPSVGLGNDGQWEFTYNGAPQSVVGSAVGVDGLTPINGYFSYDYYNEYSSNTQLFGPPLPGAPVSAGYYTFVENFTSLDPNYTGGTFSWELWIDPASPTVTINGGPFTYNGATHSGIVSAVGIDGVTPVAGTTTYITYNGSTSAPSTFGTYAVFAEFTSSDPNYYSSTADGTLVINKATPAFSSLSSPVVKVGTSTATVSGHIAAGSVAPGGDDVDITLNGITQSVAVSSSGSFSTSFNVAGLQSGTYPITYEYLGDATRFNAAGSGFASGTLTVQAGPSILSNPVSQTVASGSSVTFSATASGLPAPTVQWQKSTNGSNYSNISGASGNSYTINNVAASQNGSYYRAVFTNSVGSATTTAATLTVQATTIAAPIVTANQSSVTVTAGATVVVDSAVTVTSTDTDVNSATVTIGTGLTANDVLHFTNQNGISGSFASGVLTLSGSATPTQYQAALRSVTFSNTVNNSLATRNISIVVKDAGDTGNTNSNTATTQIVVAAPITVTGAWVENPGWGSSGTSNFFGYLASHSLGSATLGYALQTGADQLTTLPFANINTISVRFSGPVSNIGLGSLALAGGTGGGSTGAATAAPSVTGFTSDGNNTYSWSLSSSLTNNKYVFGIATTGSPFGSPGSTQVTDSRGAGISGTFTTGTSTFANDGNGLAGSTFDFFFNVLPGDGNQNGLNNSSDTSQAKLLNNDHENAAGYNPYFDYNGAGMINTVDSAIDATDSNNKQSAITSPAVPSASQPAGGTGSVVIAPLALGVQEAGSSQSSTATPATTGNVVSTSTASISSGPAVASTSTDTTSGTGSASTTVATDGHHGRHQFAATDEAVSEFDLADLYF